MLTQVAARSTGFRTQLLWRERNNKFYLRSKDERQMGRGWMQCWMMFYAILHFLCLVTVSRWQMRKMMVECVIGELLNKFHTMRQNVAF